MFRSILVNSWRALVALLTAVPLTVAAVAMNPAPAAAAVPDHWGFAFMHNATPPPGLALDATRSWGSWKALWPADPVRVFPGGVGQYRVRFPHIASTRGVAHVTAVAGDARWCQIVSVVPVGTDQDVNVMCYRNGGIPANSRFSVMYSTSSGAPLAAGAYAYVYANTLGGTIHSYNSGGGVNTVTRVAVGRYRVRLPAVGTGVVDGNVQVTSVQSNLAPRRCKVAGWAPAGAAHDLAVYCFDQANAPADSWFNLTYQRQRAVFGGLNPPRNIAYLWLPGLGGPSDYNSAGCLNSVTGSGVGQYLVRFPCVGVREGHVQVTAFGPAPDYCHLQEVWANLGAEVVVRNVICFNGAGVQAPNRFFVTYSSRV